MKREGGPGARLQEPHIESWVEDEEPAKDCEAGRKGGGKTKEYGDMETRGRKHSKERTVSCANLC